MRRDSAAKTLVIHRLVQAVLRDRMHESTKLQWAERSVRAVDRAFPLVQISTWHACERLPPSAQKCAEPIENHRFDFQECSRFLNQTGFYLYARARYPEAEPLYKRALEIRDRLGPEHSEVATILNNLALLYQSQGKYPEAEPLYKRALKIYEKVLGAEHPAVARVLQNYARLLGKIGQRMRRSRWKVRQRQSWQIHASRANVR